MIVKIKRKMKVNLNEILVRPLADTRHLSACGRFVVYNTKSGGVRDKIDGDTHIISHQRIKKIDFKSLSTKQGLKSDWRIQ